MEPQMNRDPQRQQNRGYQPKPDQLRDGYGQNYFFRENVPKKPDVKRENGIFTYDGTPQRQGKKHFGAHVTEIENESIFKPVPDPKFSSIDNSSLTLV
jgi:hypothetical protein